jgi:hypothetical protein
MAAWDRAGRFVIALLLVAAYFMNYAAGWLGYLALLIAVIFLITSVAGFCPIYSLIGLGTIGKKK